LAKGNVLTQGKKTKADAAAREGRLEEARALFKSVCQLNPSDTEAWVKLGMVHKRLGQFGEAEACARRGILLSPKLGFCHHALGVALHSQGRLNDAIGAYRKAVELQPDFPDSHYLMGCALHESGCLAEAMLALENALALKADFPEALGDLGAVLIDMGEHERAMTFLARAQVLQPGNGVVLSNISNVLRLQGKVTEALEGFRHALRLAPESVDVIASLAGLLEKTGALDEANKLLEHGLTIEPMDPALNLVAVQIARREKRFLDARDMLERLLQQPLDLSVAGDIELALGQIYDQLEDPEHAFSLIASGKAKKRQVSVLESADGKKYLERVALIGSYATPALLSYADTSLQYESPDFPAPVFLIGFPRSGTTLLEQILDAHPDIQAMEEKGAVDAMVNAFLGNAGEHPDALMTLTDDDIARLRQVYFNEVNRHIELRSGALLLDKMPLNTISVPIIWRVFPKARFILAIRHPCDASLSCLMQNFAVNEAMASFFTLEDTVATYASVMGAWQKYVQVLPLNYHRVRYEDLILNVEGESRSILDFLGLNWSDAVLNHVEHAKSRSAINTPSYHQVVQPIYQHARYRWERYAAEFEPHMEALQPFIEYFGYAE